MQLRSMNNKSSSWFQAVETAGIKFPEIKSSGVFVRSQKMKLPANIGQKKMKAIEQLLQELNIGTVELQLSKLVIWILNYLNVLEK